MTTGFTVLHVPVHNDDRLHVEAANNPDGGRIAVRVRPGIRRVGWLLRDLLAALGVDFTVTGAGRNDDENLHLLPVRLAGQRVTDLLVAGVEHLPPAMVTDLVLLAAAADVRLWLITAAPVHATVADTLGDWCASELSVEAAAARWPQLLGPTPAAAAPPPQLDACEPRNLPLVDATTLLATCRRQLRTEEAAWVEQRLAGAVADARQHLSAAAVVPDAVAGWLLSRYDHAGTLTQFVVDVRGMQVAGLWAGYLVQVDVPTLCGTAATSPSAASRTPAVWKRLQAYRLPVRAAACALAGARLGADAMCAVTLGDTAVDGTTVISDGRTIPIEPNAAGYVATQRLLRFAAGAPQDAALLADGKGKPLTDKALARLLSEARSELGIVVSSRLVERAAPDAATTLRRWGVTVTPIGDPVPSAPAAAGCVVDLAAAVVREERSLLDCALLKRRRVEMRLSRRQVAQHLGVTTAVVKRLEEGANHAEQPLALLLRLAGLYALDLADLLTREHSAAPEDADAAAAVREDARAVGAALHSLRVLVARETLADVLGWHADRLTAALDALTVAAPAAGLRVHQLYNRVSLVRDESALPPGQLEAVLRYDTARTGLDPTQARLVHAALTRAVDPPKQRGGAHMLVKSNADKVAAASLTGAGILTTDDAGDLILSADATISLLAAQATGGAA